VKLDDTARLAQRLAVLLAAGVSPTNAWNYLDGYSHLAADLPGSLRHIDPGLAAAWRVATTAGAPLAPTLQQFAAGLRALADAQREMEVALAGPVATARLVLALPLVGILFGMVLGFNTLGTLFTTVPGWLCLGVGVALLLAARRWNRRLVAAAQPTDLFAGLRFELLAIAVAGGGSLDRALSTVDAALAEFALEATGDASAVLALSQRAGVPAAALLRAEADEARRDARTAAQKAAAVLGVRLMIPLGVCVLPAFMALGVAPLLIAVISSTVAGM
jgi:tight adherence protein B